VPELPIVSGDECIRALQKLGYTIARTRGSHVRMICSGRPPTTVPRHRELDRGTLRSIIRQTELTVEEFIALLD
jgi:predicted RNA binding protein YcfA (HicA-like mRNA interferase family)